MKQFSLDLNLDDETELAAFLAEHKCRNSRRLANKLGLKGKGSARLATALSNYAWNKATALNLRKGTDGGQVQIGRAEMYETIADNIYAIDISPVCECW